MLFFLLNNFKKMNECTFKGYFLLNIVGSKDLNLFTLLKLGTRIKIY